MKNYSQSIFYFILILFSAHNLSAQHNLVFQGQLQYHYPLSNLWGYVDTLPGDTTEYALVGTDSGLSIVNVTNPVNPIQIDSINGAPSKWREVKTFNHRAYITNENEGGVMIVNLSYLPDSAPYHFFTDKGLIERAHTSWIDEKGYLYLFGSNVGYGGALMYNLNVNPDTPVYAGQYDDSLVSGYIHDGFVRGDTLWAAHIYDGTLEVVDVSDKGSPKGMAQFTTTSHFTHSSWPTSNDHYLFTTDEVANSYLSSYDVQNLNNILPLDVIQSDPGSNSTVHNVFLHNNNFATTSYYCDGVVLFDVTYPDNMIEVGNYNTSQASCNGLNGCWGEYPYLPSGNIIASDIQNGLYVLKPTYVHACWLEGIVKDSLDTSMHIINVTVTVNGTQNFANSKIDGSYKTGASDSGLYSVSFSASGYYPKTINNVHLLNGIIDTLIVLLKQLPFFTLSGTVYDSSNSPKFIDKAHVLFSSSTNTYLDSTDINGNFSIANFFPGIYKVFVGKWGYQLYFKSADNILYNALNYDVRMDTGYYDDFSLKLGWKDSSTAASGQWVRGMPIGTLIDSEYVNPNNAASPAHDNDCYMTGNTGGYYREGCLYGGWTRLTSPVFNLSTNIDPYISYYTWFFNLRNKLPANDSLVVTVSSKSDDKTLQSIKLSNTDSCEWVFQKFRIKDFVPLSDSMYVTFLAQNSDSADNVFKAAVDIFQITDSIGAGMYEIPFDSLAFSVYPDPFEENVAVSYNMSMPGIYSISVIDVTGRVVDNEKLYRNGGVLNVSLKGLPAGLYIFQIKQNNTVLRSINTAKVN